MKNQSPPVTVTDSRGGPLAVVILCLFLFLSLNVAAQKPPQPPPPTQPAPGPGVLYQPEVLVRLQELNGSPLGVPGLVWLRSLSPSINISGSALSGEAVFRGLPPGRYTVEAEAPGYVTTRETVEILSERNFTVILYMRPEAPPGATPGPPGGPVLAPKARQEVEKGLQALQANNLAKARKHLEVALRLAPGHPDVNYLFGALALRSDDLAQAKRFLEKALSLDPKHQFALISLSELHYRQQEYAEVIRLLEKGLELDASAWRVHWLLACAHFQQREFEKARDHAERALKSGKEKAGEAQLLLGQALAALGEKEKASRTLESFLRDYPTHPASSQARRLLEAVRQHADQPVRLASLSAHAGADAAAPLIASPLLASPAARWAPTDVDTAVPAVAPDVTCSLPEALQGAGQRAKELVTNLEQFTANERIEHAEFDPKGNWRPPLARSFKYLVSISEVRPGMLNVEETRDGETSLEAFPTRLATRGLAAFALIFHPYYVGDFEVACEGLGDWHGQPAWQVHFQQRPDKPPRMHGFRIGGKLYPVKLKGRAWISADAHQVVGLELDLMEPIPEIRLETDHLAIEYRPVQFAQRNLELWLPGSADQYMDFRGHRYHHRHSFSDFLLFSVDATQQVRAPPQP